MTTNTDSSIECIKRLAGKCVINSDEQYSYHLTKSIISIRDGNTKGDEQYPYMNWWAAVALYEITNKLPPRSVEMYDEMVDSS